MKITFWGVRGSIASPGKSTVKYGGHTSCVSVKGKKGDLLVLDAGTGIKNLGASLKKVKKITCLISHFHFDHICGLPFFGPLYQKANRIQILGPRGIKSRLADVFKNFFSDDFFPVPFKFFASKLVFKELGPDKIVNEGDFSIQPLLLNHPGNTLGFVISEKISGKKVAYLSDHEPSHKFRHLKKNKGSSELAEKILGVDVLITDAHFFENEYGRHKGWGHSTITDALKLASTAKVKTLVLFHHAPHHTDAALDLCKRKLKAPKGMKVIFAHEGMTLSV